MCPHELVSSAHESKEQPSIKTLDYPRYETGLTLPSLKFLSVQGGQRPATPLKKKPQNKYNYFGRDSV